MSWETWRVSVGRAPDWGHKCDKLVPHSSAEGKTITQECSACHEMVAASEASPEVLRALGLQERISKLQRK